MSDDLDDLMLLMPKVSLTAGVLRVVPMPLLELVDTSSYSGLKKILVEKVSGLLPWEFCLLT